MPKKTDERPGAGWLDRRELAAMFDVTTDHFDEYYRRYAPTDKVKTVGRRVWIHGRSLLDAWARSHANGPKATKPDNETDPMMAGPVTDQLEEYRKWRAAQEKIKFHQLEGSIVLVAEVKGILLGLCDALRRGVESVRRRFGNEPADVLEESVTEFEQEATEVIKQIEACSLPRTN